MKKINNEAEIIRQLGLKPGDRIITPKSDFNWIQHHSLYLGFDIYGNHYICENIIGRGVVLSSVKDFFTKNLVINKIEEYKGTNLDRKTIIQKALSKLGKPYSLIFYNCEHFANDIITNKPSSKQVANGLGIAIIAGVVLTLIFG